LKAKPTMREYPGPQGEKKIVGGKKWFGEPQKDIAHGGKTR